MEFLQRGAFPEFDPAVAKLILSVHILRVRAHGWFRTTFLFGCRVSSGSALLWRIGSSAFSQTRQLIAEYCGVDVIIPGVPSVRELSELLNLHPASVTGRALHPQTISLTGPQPEASLISFSRANGGF